MGNVKYVLEGLSLIPFQGNAQDVGLMNISVTENVFVLLNMEKIVEINV